MKAKKKKRPYKMKPSLYELQSKLKELMQADKEEAQARLDTLALTDPAAAVVIGENIGLFEKYPDDVEIAPGVFCTASCIK